jgi:hypothetical protein
MVRFSFGPEGGAHSPAPPQGLTPRDEGIAATDAPAALQA